VSEGFMKDIKYIMVTNFGDHWDNLPTNETSYTTGLLIGVRPEELIENAKTLFIKLSGRYGPPEKAWIGYVYGYDTKREKNRIYFKVKIEREIPLHQLPPEIQALRKSGWYLKDKVLPIETSHDSSLVPPFFSELLATNDWKEFEDCVFYLLKLIGIDEIVRYDKTEQKGHPDGFFIVKNLAVIYDATLDTKFEETKNQQIENYVNMLKKNRIDYQKDNLHLTYDISRHTKQVWIITRGTSRIKWHFDDIKVKEVSVSDLIKIYKWRLQQDPLREEELVKELVSLGENTP
jgi:hypothetical protein